MVAETLENQCADVLSVSRVMELSSVLQLDGTSFKIVVPHRRFIAEDDGFLISHNSSQVST